MNLAMNFNNVHEDKKISVKTENASAVDPLVDLFTPPDDQPADPSLLGSYEDFLNSLLAAENKVLTEEVVELRAACGIFEEDNKTLKRENAVLSEKIRALQLEVTRLRGTSHDPRVRFALGGYNFSAQIHPEIHFARAGSRIAVYPPNSGTTAVARLDFGDLNHNNTEPVNFVGTLHSITETRPSQPSG